MLDDQPSRSERAKRASLTQVIAKSEIMSGPIPQNWRASPKKKKKTKGGDSETTERAGGGSRSSTHTLLKRNERVRGKRGVFKRTGGPEKGDI